MRAATSKILFVLVDNFKTERLGIQILSAIAQEEGFERDLLIIRETAREDAIRKAVELRPKIVAYSAMTFEQFDLQDFNRELKATGLDFVSIFGGHHYTFSPEEIDLDQAMDVVCVGEGETAFRRFIRAVRDEKDFSGLENLWVRHDKRVVKNPVGPLVQNLDEIPYPDRNLLPLGEGGKQIFGKSFQLLFGRGCPYRCAYCFNIGWNRLYRGQKIIRFRSVENIIDEIKTIGREHDFDLIYFDDDDFTLIPRETIEKFCRLYKAEIGKPFYIQVRATGVDEELIAMLKDAGLVLVGMGVECGDEKISSEILHRRNITNRDIIRAFDIFNKYHIKSFSQNLFALPVSNPLEADLKTILLNARCRPTWAQCNILLPIPKTPMFDYCVEHGYLPKDAFNHPKRLPSGFTSSTLEYRDRRLANRVNNLHKFAGIVIRFPRLLPVVKLLIRLPPNSLYQYIFFGWYGYWNTAGLWGTKLSPQLILNGLKAIKQYMKKH